MLPGLFLLNENKKPGTGTGRAPVANTEDYFLRFSN